MNEQIENIARVSQQIGHYVTQFLDSHINQEFHADELRNFVFANVNGYIAPASPDRILRQLRQQGKVSYEVVSRAKSLYKALPVTGQLQLF